MGGLSLGHGNPKEDELLLGKEEDGRKLNDLDCIWDAMENDLNWGLMKPSIEFTNEGESVEYREAKGDFSLNLSLNYQEVIDAWSDRGPLWAQDLCSTSNASYCSAGEVPVTEEEKEKRRARVHKYKEKRQSRLFAKKIRYEVRKLTAEKRPRLKGRFVKRDPDT